LKTLAKISKLKPVIWTLHDMWSITPFCAYSYGGSLKNGFYQCPSLSSYPAILWHNEKYLTKRKKEIYDKSNFDLVVPSKWLEKKVKNSILGDKKCHLIYNGIDQDIFRNDININYREKLGLDKNKKIILFLSDGGKSNPAKGWSYVEGVIENFKKKDDLLFVCIGGKEKGFDKKYKNLLYIPRINDKKILASYFSVSDIFLYPTLAETFGLVVAEAMSCGVPIVTFKTGGVPELVKHLRNGYVADYKDLNDLIEGVNYILDLDKKEILEIKNKSINDVLSNFTEDKMVDQYVKLYKEKINSWNKNES
jgi:glycosyltransferase involved in cell wall biosynthesis